MMPSSSRRSSVVSNTSDGVDSEFGDMVASVRFDSVMSLRGRQISRYNRRRESECSLQAEVFDIDFGCPQDIHCDPYIQYCEEVGDDEEDLPAQIIAPPGSPPLSSPCSGSSDTGEGTPDSDELPPAYVRSPSEFPIEKVPPKPSFSSRIQHAKNNALTSMSLSQFGSPKPSVCMRYGFSRSNFFRRNPSKPMGVLKKESQMSIADSCLSTSYIHDANAMARYGSILLTNCQHAVEYDSPSISRTISEITWDDLDATVMTIPQAAAAAPHPTVADDDDDMEVEVLNITI